MAIAATAVFAMALPVAAQEEAPATDAEATATDVVALEVSGVDYAFVGLPTSVPAGTNLGFTNNGAEFHEIVVARVADDTTESLEELLAMGDAALTEGKVEIVGEGPLFANPGETAAGTLALEREGRYVALCFIPQGFVPSELEALGITPEMMGPDTDPTTLPPEVQAIMANPPHLALGMLQEFTVTAAGTEPGPLPAAPPEEAG
jgi:plastocyanin